MKSQLKIGFGTQLAIGLALFTAALTGATLLLIAANMKARAISEAEEKAQLLLNHNLAIHAYFTRQLKPHVFQLSDPSKGPEYFDPVWMSSTYAVRSIDADFHKLSDNSGEFGDYYYKECAINARSPANEADAAERDFIQRLNSDPTMMTATSIKEIDGHKYLVLLRRGEKMEQECLRCHSEPQRAPAELVAAYGAQRSFHRYLGEVVSAASIRIPLRQAYASVSRISLMLMLEFTATAILAFAALYWFGSVAFLAPVKRIRDKALLISSSDAHLGEQIATPVSAELADVVAAFNQMSSSLQLSQAQIRRHAESIVAEVQQRLADTFQRMHDGFALHEIIRAADGRPVDYRYLSVNPAFEQMMGVSAADIIGKTATETDGPGGLERIAEFGRAALEGGQTNYREQVQPAGRYYEVTVYQSKPGQFACLYQDITEHEHATQQREQLILELQSALADVKTLTGLLPICAACKKIRDDQGYWQQIEAYIGKHSKAVFSHGICPDCAQRLYPGLTD